MQAALCCLVLELQLTSCPQHVVNVHCQSATDSLHGVCFCHGPSMFVPCLTSALCCRETFHLPDDLTEEEKLEPVKNATADPRIRLLNRLYAKKRKVGLQVLCCTAQCSKH